MRTFGYNRDTWFKLELQLIMTRILILIILGFILVQILKRFIASTDANASAKTAKKTEEKSEQMVQCANCGCHVPISESQNKNNQTICNNPECITDASAKK